jgi:hypothetical protein
MECRSSGTPSLRIGRCLTAREVLRHHDERRYWWWLHRHIVSRLSNHITPQWFIRSRTPFGRWRERPLHLRCTLPFKPSFQAERIAGCIAVDFPERAIPTDASSWHVLFPKWPVFIQIDLQCFRARLGAGWVQSPAAPLFKAQEYRLGLKFGVHVIARARCRLKKIFNHLSHNKVRVRGWARNQLRAGCRG